jgi:uncharacterized Fe-S cluster-containing radical SAM superfamily enzyme
LFRRTLLGWYVRFTTTASSSNHELRKKRGNQARRDRTVNRSPRAKTCGRRSRVSKPFRRGDAITSEVRPRGRFQLQPLPAARE